jgi:diguanylate cyclase (GGDEF)-like protein
MEQARLSDVLTEFALTLVEDVPNTKILDHLVRRIVDVLPVTSAGVTLITAGNDARYVAASDQAAHRYETLQTELSEGPCLLSYDSGHPVLVPDMHLEQRFPSFGPAATAAGLGAVFTFPLFHGHGRFGALDLYRSTPGPLSSEEVEAAQTLANVAAVYLINAQKHAEAADRAQFMVHMATHDDLTGLPNMRLLRERIEQAGRRATRSETSAALLFLDLDDFKRINDSFGHENGDRLLCGIANRLVRLVRPGDTVARIHGDEFVLLCEDLLDRTDVEAIVDRIRLSFERPFLLGEHRVTVSASIGTAFSEAAGQLTEDLIAQADRAMYAGRRAAAPADTVSSTDAAGEGA